MSARKPATPGLVAKTPEAEVITEMDKANMVLDPDLSEFAMKLNAEARIRLAERLARQANQLVESAVILNPDLVPQFAPPKLPRGFFLVNLSQREQDELRTLAHQCGYDLRSLVGWGVTTAQCHLREQIRIAKLVGVHPRECWRLGFAGDQRN